MPCKKQKQIPKDKPRAGTLSPPKFFKQKPTVYCAKDPVKASNLNEQLLRILENSARIALPEKKRDFLIQPDITKRTQLGKRPDPTLPAPSYVVPLSNKEKKARAERRLKAERDRNFCKWKILDMGQFYRSAGSVSSALKNPSPEVNTKKLTVKPKEPSLDAQPASLQAKRKSNGNRKKKT